MVTSWLRGNSRRGSRKSQAAAAALAAAVLTAVIVVTAVHLAGSAADAPAVTSSQNSLSDGWDHGEPSLSPAAVSGPGFGQLFSAAVTGSVLAQPVVAGGTLVVAT